MHTERSDPRRRRSLPPVNRDRRESRFQCRLGDSLSEMTIDELAKAVQTCQNRCDDFVHCQGVLKIGPDDALFRLVECDVDGAEMRDVVMILPQGAEPGEL